MFHSGINMYGQIAGNYCVITYCCFEVLILEVLIFGNINDNCFRIFLMVCKCDICKRLARLTILFVIRSWRNNSLRGKLAI